MNALPVSPRAVRAYTESAGKPLSNAPNNIPAEHPSRQHGVVCELLMQNENPVAHP